MRRTATGQIDWEAVRRDLHGGTMPERVAISAQRGREIMDARARALARPPQEDALRSGKLELLTFELGAERYAVETRYVREVIRPGEITGVPHAPAVLIGVTNLRGEILAVVNLGKLLGVDVECGDEAPWVVVCGAERTEFGAVVSAIRGVTVLPAREILHPAAEAAAGNQKLIRGITADSVTVLDGAGLFNDPRLLIEEEEKSKT